MKNEKWFRDILAEVRFGEGYPVASFYYHPFYRVGVGKDTNLDYTFGRKRKIPWKNFRKFKYFNFNAPFPTDSVIFFQPGRKRLIISSQKEGKVLKVSVSAEQLTLLEGEIRELTFQNQSEFAPHSVKLLDHGPNWIMTSFCSNLDSVADMPILELHDLVMPPMTKFYRSHGLEKVLIKDWIQVARQKAQGHPHIELINKLISKIEAVSTDVELIKGQLHFDLHHGNVLRAEEQVVIIDWEVSHPGLLLVDYFDFYRRLLKSDDSEFDKFVNFLQNQTPSSKYSNFMHKFRIWNQGFGAVNYENIDRLMPLIYSIERTLIYYEKWREDRLADKKGIELAIAIHC